MVIFQINNETDYIQKDWFCSKCSKNFYKFFEDFLDLNSDINKKISSFNNRNFMLRSDSKRFTDIIKYLLDIIEKFKDILSSSVIISNEKFTKIVECKFPILNTDDPVFNQFVSTLPEKQKYFKFQDLHEFYNFCREREYMRKDIFDKRLVINCDDIEYLEDKYDVFYEKISFPRKNLRGGLTVNEYMEEEDLYYSDFDIYHDEAVNSISYTTEKAVLLNYLSFLYCYNCEFNYNYCECIGEKMYLLSAIVTKIYNSMVGPIQYSLIHTKKYDGFREMLSKKLHEISNTWGSAPYCHLWRGVKRYYEILGILPLPLVKIGVPEEHYLHRVNTYFEDVIKGHPRASDGWFSESLNEMIDLGVF